MNRSLFALLFLLCATLAKAQDLTISGTVTDEKDAVISGVAVVLRGPTGEPAKATSAAQGEFKFEGLKPGSYEISFSRENFAGATRTLTLTNQSRTVDVALSLGRILTTLDVTDSAGIHPLTRLSVSDMEVPAMTSVISQQTLREQNINDMITALENVSGVTTQLQYGSMEWYTIGGMVQQSGNEFLFVNGMASTGNRPNTQLTNVESIEVLKGPAGMMMGNTGSGNGGAGGAINVTLKKPQAQPVQEFLYRVGRWNRHEFAGSSAGRVFNWNKLLYRVDLGTSHLDGWRGSGSNRFNLTPSATWLINERGRVTVQQSFTRDRYTMDSGLPSTIYLTRPDFPVDRKFNRDGEFDLYRMAQTTINFEYDLGGGVKLQNQFFKGVNNEFYYHAESITYVPATFMLNRQQWAFKSNRRPIQNNITLTGTHRALGMNHQWAAGYVIQEHYNWQERFLPTAGGTGSQIPIAPIDLNAWLQPGYVDPEPIRTVFNRSAQQFVAVSYPRYTIQDHITVMPNRLFLSLQGSFSTTKRRSHNDVWNPANDTFVSRGADVIIRNQTGKPYLVGVTYFIVPARWETYFSVSTNFRPLTSIPTNLHPSINADTLKSPTSKSYAIGSKWRSTGGRLRAQFEIGQTMAKDNLTTVFDEALGANFSLPVGQTTTRRADADVEGYLGWGVRATTVYGYAACRIEGPASATFGRRCQYAIRHSGRTFLTKQLRVGNDKRLNLSLGATYRSKNPLNTNQNFAYLGGWIRFDAAAGFEFTNKWSATVNIQNLLNRQRYIPTLSFGNWHPGPPFAASLTLRYQFGHAE